MSARFSADVPNRIAANHSPDEAMGFAGRLDARDGLLSLRDARAGEGGH